MSIKSCKHLKQLDCAFPTDIRDTVGVASVIYFTGLNRGKQTLRFQSLKSENEKQIFSLSIFSMKYCLLRWLRLPARKSIYSSSLELLLLRQYLEREHETLQSGHNSSAPKIAMLARYYCLNTGSHQRRSFFYSSMSVCLYIYNIYIYIYIQRWPRVRVAADPSLRAVMFIQAQIRTELS